MKKYESIKDVVGAVKSGEIDEANLEVVMDNDCSSILCGPCEDADGNEIDNEIYTGDGYYDTEDLWPLVFPKAKVGWC